MIGGRNRGYYEPGISRYYGGGSPQAPMMQNFGQNGFPPPNQGPYQQQPQGPISAPYQQPEQASYQSVRPNETGYNMGGNPQFMQPAQTHLNAGSGAAQQYGLSGAESALKQGAIQGIGSVTGGAQAAGGALQQGG